MLYVGKCGICDRSTWRSMIHMGATHAEALWTTAAKEKRGTRALNTVDMPPTHWCQTCGRGFHANIGIISHMRAHRTSL